MIPSGYKQTEIGVIPEDWEVIPFSKCFDTIKNNTLSRAELNYDGGNIRNIHYGDVLINFPSIVDCQKETIPFINEDATESAGNSFLQDGDIVIADTAEDNTVGKAVEVFNIGDSKVVAGLHTMPCRPKNKFAEKFLGYYINARVFHDQIIPFITGTKVSSISKKAIDDTTVLVPPFAEQKRIADALSDVDELIASLEKLIEKKKALKQGVMQELLTGKRRLPGFTGEWVEKPLSEVITLNNGYPFKSSGYSSNGKYIVLTISNVQKGYMDLTSYNTMVKLPADIQSYQILKLGDLLISMTGNVGRVCKVSENNCLLNQRVGKLSVNYENDDQFIFHVLNSDRFISEMIDKASGGAQPNIGKKDIYSYIIYMPNDKQEQIAIASVLSIINDEIAAKESELKKYRKLKSGMMSELLTGRIRLM